MFARRALGMGISWCGFALAFTLMFLSTRAVLAVGGFCAEGGPYEIVVHCPAGVEGFLPLGIYLGLATVAAGVFVARAFGAQLVLWAWPILFIGLGYNFLEEGFFNGVGVDPVGVGISVVFMIMGAVPLVILLRQKNAIRALTAVACASTARFWSPSGSSRHPQRPRSEHVGRHIAGMPARAYPASQRSRRIPLRRRCARSTIWCSCRSGSSKPRWASGLRSRGSSLAVSLRADRDAQ